jgi:hypothetical protein
MDDLVERLERWAEFGYGDEASEAMRQATAQIRSLRAQVAQERAGIVVWLRDGHDGKLISRMALADAIEAHEDKK